MIEPEKCKKGRNWTGGARTDLPMEQSVNTVLTKKHNNQWDNGSHALMITKNSVMPMGLISCHSLNAEPKAILHHFCLLWQRPTFRQMSMFHPWCTFTNFQTISDERELNHWGWLDNTRENFFWISSLMAHQIYENFSVLSWNFFVFSWMNKQLEKKVLVCILITIVSWRAEEWLL